MPVLIVGMLIGLGLGQPAAAQQDLLGYWSFNAPEGSGNPWPTPVEPTFGDGTITYNFGTGNLSDFDGDTDNVQGADAAGKSFSVEDDAENGNHFDIAVSTENAENIELVFWARRTGTGFDNNTVSYSTDGGATFTQEFTFDPDDTTSGTVETFDFSGITALNNNSDVVFRITLNGATSATGNNRFDNITVRGDLQPASGPLALTAIDEPTRLNFQGFRAGGFEASPSFGQLDSDAVAVFGASDGNVDFGQTATGGDFARGSSTGGVGTGGVYAFDISKPTDLDNGYGDYALGLQPAGSDFSPGTVYVCYENNTGTAINDGADVDYDLWTLNDTDRSRTVTLKYAVGASCQTDAADASSFNDGQLAFTVEESADSDPEWMRNALSGRIPAGVPSGEFLTLAFVTTDGGGSGGSPEVALNDIAVTPRSTPGGPIVISNTDDTLIEDFDSFAGSGFDSPPESPEQLDSGAFIVRGLSDGDLGFGNTEDSGDFARGASTGGESTGGIYAFEVASGDFAWGVQPTGSDATPGAFVARYLNDTGEPITDAFVGYDIEVLNNEGRSTDVSLAYQVTSSTSYDASGFTGISAFDYTTPKAADSSPTWQTVPRSGTLADINLQNGEYLLLRWETDDAAGSGSRDEIALNNLSLTPNPPTVSFVDTERAVWSTDDTATFEVQIRNPGSEAHTVEVAFDSGNSTADPADVDNFGTQTVTFPASASNGDRETVTVDLNAFSGDATRDAQFVLQNPSADVRIGAANTYTFDIGDAPRVLISRYIDTSSGSTPKGLQLWNVSGETIDFSTDPLEVFTSFNGGETTSTTTVDTGTLAADDILIVGASDDEGDPDDLGTKAAACTPEVQFVEEQSNTWFNGNDAVRIRLDGRTEDMIGIVGEDPGEGNSWNGNGVSTKDQYLGVQPGTTSGNRNGFTDPSTRFLTLNEDPTTADGDAGGFCNAPWPEASFLASEATVVQGDTEATTLGASLQLIPAEGRATDVTVTFDETSSSASSGNIDGFTSSTLTFPGGSAQDTTETVLDLTFPTNTSQDGPLEAVFTSDVETADCFTAECFAEARSESLKITILDSESTPDVLISEFMARPDAVPDADGEWVELYNSTDSDIDLSGWSLQTTASAEADLSGVTLPVRSFLTVCGNDNASENGGVRCDLQADIELDDTGGTLAVKDNGAAVTTVEYGVDRSSGTLDPIAGASSVFTGTAQNNNADRWAVAEQREKGFLFAKNNPDRTDLGSPGQNGPRQQLQPAATIDGNSGWRMLGPPVGNFTVADLDAQNMVQGVSDLPLGGAANVYRWEETGWEPVSSGSNALPPGEGFIWYMWDTSAPVDQYSPFPFTLSGEGVPPADDMAVNVENGGTAGNDGDPAGDDVEWHLLGNPYPYAFDLNGVNLADQGFTTTAQIWDPSRNGGSGSYIQRSQENAGTAQQIAPWQGFFVSRASGTATELTFSADGRRLAPVTPKSNPEERSQARIAFSLSGYDADGAIQTYDEAFEVFLHPDATTSFDVRSAVKLTPMTDTYATLAGHDTHEDAPIRLSRYSLPFELNEPAVVPVVLDAQNIEDVDRLTVQWPTMQGLRTGWQVHLRDLETGAEVDLRNESSYTFDADAAVPNTTTSVQQSTAHAPRTAMTMDQHARPLSEDTEARFEIHIAPANSSDDPLPVELSDFRVQTADEAATLQWTTLSETNNAGFEVQHQGPEAEAFASLGFVEGQGTTNERQTYTFETSALNPGTHRFRLQQRDTDGTSTLTEPQTVDVQMQEAAQLRVYPVPVREDATVQFAVDSAQEVTIEVYNALGQRVRTLHQGPVAAQQTETLQWGGSGLASGLYIVRLRGEKSSATQRITVVR